MKNCLTLAVLFIYSLVHSQTLTLKPGFGNAGIVLTNLSDNAPYFAFTTGQQSDGKMIVGGSTLMRLLSNGDVDSSFGVNGLAIKAEFPYKNTLAVQTDDRIVCALNNYSETVLKRFTAAGDIDSSFNSTGITILSEPGAVVDIRRVRPQADGKILLVGSKTASGKTSFFIARYLPDGTADGSFNSNGRLTLDTSPGDNVAYDIGEQSTGQLVVAGTGKSAPLADAHAHIIRLNNDGTVDNDFNLTGNVIYGNSSASGNILQLYPDDKILLAGTAAQQLLLMRLQANGAVDSSFAVNGIITDPGLGITFPGEIHMANDGSIIVTAQSSDAFITDWQYAAFNFNTDGSLNNSFNGNGKTFLTVPGNDYAAGSIVRSDESILLAGYSDSARFASTALISNSGSFDNTHGEAGIKSLLINGTDEVVNTLLRQTDNKIITIANQTNSLATFLRTILIRYNTDGTIDSSFAINGITEITEDKFVYHSAILQPDGKILLMGDKVGEGPDFISNICLLRLNADGTTDTGFGVDGKVLLALAGTSGYGKGLALLTDGRIIIAGRDAVISRLIVAFALNSNGSADAGFGTNGKRSIDPGFPEIGLGSIAVQADNKILLGGYLVQGNNQSGFFCLRLLVNGSTDNSFGTNGLYRTATSSSSFLELNAVLVTAADKILLAGHVSNPSGRSSSVQVIRLLPTGVADNSFRGNGTANFYKNLNHDSTFVIPNAMAIHPDSSIYIVGSSVNISGSYSEFIIRIRQNGILDSSISTEGSGWYYNNQGGLNAVLNDIAIAPDSSIYVAGGKDAIGTNNDMLIAAYKRLPDTIGISYVFIGNGLWTDAANWLDALVPPANLPNGATIFVNPVVNGTAILNTEQNIEAGGRIIVRNNARFRIENNLNIGN